MNQQTTVWRQVLSRPLTCSKAQKLMSLDVGRALCRLHEEGEVGLETKGLVSHSMGASLLLLSLLWSFFSEY